MPINDPNELTKLQARIQNATSLGELSDIYASLNTAYQGGGLSYQFYQELYDLYKAKYEAVASGGTTGGMGGNTGATGQTGTYSGVKALTPEQQKYLTEEDPATAWNRALNLPSVGANPFQAWQSQQSRPAYSAYAGQEILNRQQRLTPQSFQAYMGPQGKQAGDTALNALTGAKGMTSAGQGDWMSQLEGQDIGGSLAALFQAALQGKGYASPFTRAATRNLPGYQQQWTADTAAGGVEGSPTLLEYLMKQMGL